MPTRLLARVMASSPLLEVLNSHNRAIFSAASPAQDRHWMHVKQGNASRHDVEGAAQSPRSGSFLGGDRSVRPGARRRRDDGALCRGSVRLAFFKVAFSLRHGIRYMRKADDRPVQRVCKRAHGGSLHLHSECAQIARGRNHDLGFAIGHVRRPGRTAVHSDAAKPRQSPLDVSEKPCVGGFREGRRRR